MGVQQIANINDVRKIKISSASSLHSKAWKTDEVSWGDFVEKFRVPKVTPETREEFNAASQERQLALKDAAGGFVGGAMASVGRRTSGAITGRQLVCLDVDFATAGFVESLGLLFDWSFVLHTTRKHAIEKPKYRILIPVDRALNELEYLAVSRRLGAWVGMDLLDHTTFQYERLMFWPTVSSDDLVNYRCEVQEGPWVCADEVLATYVDPSDPREWPQHKKEAKLQKASLTKAGAPEEKPGVVGAFCRTYSLEEVMAGFLGDVYEAAGAGRWRYIEGTGGAGVYKVGEGETGYAKSEHYSDPANVGRPLCAWDFVRIHLFGELDGDKRETETNVTKLPSHKAMCEWALKQPGVREELLAEDGFSAVADDDEDDAGAAAAAVGDAVEEESWTKRLTFKEDGGVAGTIANVVVILTGHPAFKGALRQNLFTDNLDVVRELPWFRESGQPWGDRDTAQLRCFLEQTPYFITKRDIVDAGIDIAASLGRYHPVRDYLDGLFWDGKKRIETLLIDYFGAEDNEYVRMVTTRFLAGAVARIYQPGCKWDETLALVGAQGVGKSTFVRKLAQDTWYTDSLPNLEDKDAKAALKGKWIVELGEMAATRKADILKTRAFLSAREDQYRPAYGRREIVQKRQCVFFGTTNEPDFLHDTAGNRRYWPVQAGVGKVTKSVWDDLTKTEIDQIWAEAVEIYHEGGFWFLNDHQRKLAEIVQEKHTERDAEAGIIEDWLARELPTDWANYTPSMREQYSPEQFSGQKVRRERVCAAEIWRECLGNSGYPPRNVSARLLSIVDKIPGWSYRASRKRVPNYGSQCCAERDS